MFKTHIKFCPRGIILKKIINTDFEGPSVVGLFLYRLFVFLCNTAKSKPPQKAISPHLEACPLGGVFLEVVHGVQHLLVAAGDQAERRQDLQRRDLRTDVFHAQALCDDVDGLGVGQHVRASLL